MFTDDTHEPLLHKRYLYVFNRLEEFIGRYLKGTPARIDGAAASSRCASFWLTLFAIGAAACARVRVAGRRAVDGGGLRRRSSCPGCGAR